MIKIDHRNDRKGKNHPKYNGCKLPYHNDWNEKLKEKIKKRDNNICQICGFKEKIVSFNNFKITIIFSGKSLLIHHIDGNKQNSIEENLILICKNCHTYIHFGGNIPKEILEKIGYYRNFLLEYIVE